MTFIKWFAGFFENNNEGGSMRKLIAVWFMILISCIHGKYLRYTTSGNQEADFSFAGTLLYVDVVMVALLLSLIVAQELIKVIALLKNGKFDPKEEEKKPE